jgi:glycosyltransferase involved in cell wall biosynthesis
MNTPKVSIILMTYNQGKYLHTAIQSALSQTYENIEILISNNGSSDDTTNIVQSFLPNKKITYLNYPKNESVNLRANQAIDLASGDFISWLYGDDYYLDEKIQTQIHAFNSLDKSYGIVYGPGYNFQYPQLLRSLLRKIPSKMGKNWRYQSYLFFSEKRLLQEPSSG